MTVITITTIGFKEVHELTFPGKIFTLFIIFTGIGVVGYTVFAGTQLVVEGEINKILTRRRSMKAIEKLRITLSFPDLEEWAPLFVSSPMPGHISW
jgi:voltage-gated potassium channel